MLLDLTHAAALVGAQRPDLLARKVVALKEGVHGHRHRPAPVGEDDDHAVVARHVDVARKLGARLHLELGHRLLDARLVLRRVRLDALDVEQVASAGLRGKPGEHLRVSVLKLGDAAVHVVLSRVREVRDQGLHASLFAWFQTNRSPLYPTGRARTIAKARTSRCQTRKA